MVAAWPDEILNPLREATLAADLDRMLCVIRRMEKTDGIGAGRLRALAENFDYLTLMDVITR